MSTTSSEVVPVGAAADGPDQVVHIWCNQCRTASPMKALCGEHLEPASEIKDVQVLPDCGLCLELEQMHRRLLHPKSS